MLAYLDGMEIAALGTIVLICCFFLGIVMDGLMEEDGFGATGNMMVLAAGAFLGFYAVDYLGFPPRDYPSQAIGAVTGGFVSIGLLAVMKNLLARLGF